MTAEPRLEVVWCDFGGVLTPPLSETVAAFSTRAGISWDALAHAIEGVASDLGTTGMLPLERGMIGQADWGRRVEAELAAVGERPAIDLARWDEHWYHDRPVDEALLSALAALRDGGVRVGMLTNSVREWEPHRERMLRGWEHVFDVVVRSHALGVAKPDPAIFAAAEARLPSGGAALLIDDMPANCAAARVFGWQAHLYADSASTVELLLARSARRPLGAG